MKKFLFLLLCVILCSEVSFSQAKKPSVMVVPGDNWCSQNGFMTTYDNQGISVDIPDYKKALVQSSDLLLVISKLGEMMIERGFELKLLDASMKSIQGEQAEDALLISKDGMGSVSESPIDKLKKVAKADIIMEINWTVNSKGPKKSVTFNLVGKDAYTDKQIASSSGTGPESFTAELPVLLEEAVLSHIDNFNGQLQAHFDEMFEHGREIVLRIKLFDSAGYDLESEDFGDDELGVLIENWISENTVQGRFNTVDATENMMLFEDVRIPLYNESGKAINARDWARGLNKHLKTLGIESKVMMKGLGQATIVLGGK